MEEFYQIEHKKESDWFHCKWRPAIGWAFMAICLFDFIIAPVLWNIMQFGFGWAIATPWEPMTLKAGGVFYMSMGAIVGVTSYGRSQEKMSRMKGDS